MTTRALSLPEIASSQDRKDITHNQALHLLDAISGSVLSRTNGGPPGSPTEGDAYIVDSLTGNWSGLTLGDIAVYYRDSTDSAVWVAVSPSQGPAIYVEDENARAQWDGSDWQLVASIANQGADISSSRTLVIGDANKKFRVTAAATVTVPEDSTTDFALGTRITLRRTGAGSVVIAGAGSVTLEIRSSSSLTISEQHDFRTLEKAGADLWEVS